MMRKTGLTAISLAVIAACGMPDQKTARLQDTLRYYDASLRWGEYGKALEMQTREDRAQGTDHERLRDIKVTQMKALEEKRSDDGDLFERTLEISYYREPEYSLKTVTDKQVWRYDSDKKSWLLEGDIPEFR